MRPDGGKRAERPSSWIVVPICSMAPIIASVHSAAVTICWDSGRVEIIRIVGELPGTVYSGGTPVGLIAFEGKSFYETRKKHE